MRRWLDRAAIGVAAMLAAAVLISWTAGLGLVGSAWRVPALAGWLADSLCHFQLGYAVGFAIVLPVLALRRRWLPAAACVPFAASVALQLLPFVGPTVPAAHATAARELTVTTFNLWYGNQHLDQVMRWLRASDADVIVLSEVTPQLRRALAPALTAYPHQLTNIGGSGPRADLVVASRQPLTLEPLAEPAERDYLLAARLCRADDAGQCLRLIAAHLPSPVSPRRVVHRDRLLARIAELVRAPGGPAVVLGDLNTTPWAPGFRAMVDAAGLQDSARGRGLAPTWNVRLPVSVVPIDHVLVTPGIAVVTRRVGPDLYSDHVPVTARLRF